MKVNWIKIREEYAANPEISLDDLAAKYIVSKRTMYEMSRKEGWVQLRRKSSEKLQEILPDKIAETAGQYQAKKFKQGAEIADKAVRVLLDDNTKIGGKVATEMLVAGHKLQTEALGLDNPKTQVIMNQQNNNIMMFTSIDEFMKEMHKRIEEEKGGGE